MNSATEREQALFKKRLNALLKLPCNGSCADCPSRFPRWASINLGIFLCANCAGHHRSLGVHITKVRSIELDKWQLSSVETMENIGNERANEYWEANLPPCFSKPKENSHRFVKDKYQLKLYIRKGELPQVPVVAQVDAPLIEWADFSSQVDDWADFISAKPVDTWSTSKNEIMDLFN